MGAKKTRTEAPGILSRIHDAEPVLSAVGWLHVVALLVCIVSAPFDPRTVLGLNPWIKPMKFAISITLYVWTLAWFLRYLSPPRWALQLVRWGVSLAMLVLMGCIWLQSARGAASHFNIATGFDMAVFAVIGIVAVCNTALIAVVFAASFWEHADIQPAYLWGIRFGLIVFFLAGYQGMFIILNQGHTVGAADDGAGLPFLNWSTEAGDLRIPHLLGIHGLQILPLIGHTISRWKKLPAALQVAAVTAVSIAYAAATYFLYRQAMSGTPLIAL